MYIGNAVLVYRDGVHIHEGEVADSATEGALDQEGVPGILKVCGCFGLDNLEQLFFAEEEGIVVFGFHDGLAALLAQLAERGLADFVGVLHLGEESLEHL